jgi:hypothetical protein
VQLSAGEAFSVALHPGVERIEVRGSSRQIEVCPASLDGGAPGGEGQSWPSYAGFSSCLAPDATGLVQIPSVVIPTFHVAFLVRGRNGAAINLRTLRIAYVPGDGFFGFSAPSFTRRHPDATFSVTSRVDRSIGVETTARSGMRVRVAQRGVSVPLVETSLVTRRFGPVDLDRPVTVRVGAPPGAGPRVSWFVRWE